MLCGGWVKKRESFDEVKSFGYLRVIGYFTLIQPNRQ